MKPGRKLAAAARLLRLLRETFPTIEDPDVALETLLTSLALEREVFAAGNVALGKIDGLTRRTRLWLLGYDADALYGIGLLSMRQLREHREGDHGDRRAQSAAARVPRHGALPRADSRSGAAARSSSSSAGTIDRWGSSLDPAARQYVPDRLRGSPMLNYGAVLDHVVEDVNALSGVQHEIMGERVGGGVRALNPGLARGVLQELEARAVAARPRPERDLPAARDDAGSRARSPAS